MIKKLAFDKPAEDTEAGNTAKDLTRRQVVSGLTGSATAMLGFSLVSPALGAAEAEEDIRPIAQPAGRCKLLPEAVEGPFYFDPKLVRQDIREDQPGMPVALALTVIEGGSCQPIPKARVDVWHSDALGVYSGYERQGDHGSSERGETHLRGTQFTDDQGKVKFISIYPGWYPGRTPHIHLKVFLDERTVLTGQIYFPDELSQQVYAAHAPYNKRPAADTSNKTDWLFKSASSEGGGIVLGTKRDDEMLVASLDIAVSRDGRQASGGLKGFWRGLFGN